MSSIHLREFLREGRQHRSQAWPPGAVPRHRRSLGRPGQPVVDQQPRRSQFSAGHLPLRTPDRCGVSHMSQPQSTGTMLKSLFCRARFALLWHGPTVAEILPRQHNNFDLLRLLAASAVLLGHAFVLSPRPGSSDPVERLIHFNNSSGLAVATFFFLSGLLVSESLQRTKSLTRFAAAPIARIFPGLAVSLVFSVVIVGPLFGSLGFFDYITAPTTLSLSTQSFADRPAMGPAWRFSSELASFERLPLDTPDRSLPLSGPWALRIVGLFL